MQPKKILFIVLALLTALAVLGHFAYPLTPSNVAALMTQLGLNPQLGGHAFIDKRSWFGIANTFDVLSNAPFALLGAWGLWRLSKAGAALGSAWLAAYAVLCIGLIATAIGSSYYHLAPDAPRLVVDRAGMAIIFAGIIGLGVASRVALEAAIKVMAFLLAASTLALWVSAASGDVLPWAVVQFGGMGLVLWLAYLKPLLPSPPAPLVPLLAMIVFYGFAKIAEASDVAIFNLTGQLIRGHSLKHLFAALALWPLLNALRSVSKE